MYVCTYVRQAQEGVPGPVFVEFPIDILYPIGDVMKGGRSFVVGVFAQSLFHTFAQSLFPTFAQSVKSLEKKKFAYPMSTHATH